jgi:hypothetical protein
MIKSAERIIMIIGILCLGNNCPLGCLLTPLISRVVKNVVKKRTIGVLTNFQKNYLKTGRFLIVQDNFGQFIDVVRRNYVS